MTAPAVPVEPETGPADPPVEPIRWGVVGCGWVTHDFVVPALLSAPSARLTQLLDVDRSAACRLSTELDRAGLDVEPHGIGDADAFWNRPDLDAVYVATPNSAHRGVVDRALRAGVPVLVEKPVAADVADAEALLAVARETDVPVLVAYDQRHHPAHEELARMVRDGELGTVTAVRVVYACWLPADWADDNWRVDPSRAGGGAGVDLAPHAVDLVGQVLGEDLVELVATAATRVQDYDVDDTCLLMGRTASGVLVQVHVSYATPDALPRRRLEVVGTRAMVEATNTMGQTPGGSLVVRDGETGEARTVEFDRRPSVRGDVRGDPFARMVEAASRHLREAGDWRSDAERDVRLHTLLLDALAAAGAVRAAPGGRRPDGVRRAA